MGQGYKQGAHLRDYGTNLEVNNDLGATNVADNTEKVVPFWIYFIERDDKICQYTG